MARQKTNKLNKLNKPQIVKPIFCNFAFKPPLSKGTIYANVPFEVMAVGFALRRHWHLAPWQAIRVGSMLIHKFAHDTEVIQTK